MAIDMAYNLYTPAENEKKDLPPVILIHCLGENKATWINIGPMIAKGTGRNVYSVDLRNHGDSPWNDKYGTDILVEDLDHFLIQHQIPTAVVLGHSMGGSVAMRFALKRPEKVEKLMVEDTPTKRIGHLNAHVASAGLSMFIAGEDATKNCSDEKSAKEALRKHFLQLAPLTRISKETVLAQTTDVLPFEWNGKYMELKLNKPVLKKFLRERKLTRPCVGTYDGDALFLYGAQSPAGVTKDDSLKKHFPRAIIKPFLKNLGHFLHSADEKKFAEEVISFMTDSSRIQSKY